MSAPREGLDFRSAGFAAKQLPHDIDAEQSVIGMALYVNDSVDRADGLLADHFYEPAHGRVWAAIAALVARGSSADPVTVAAKLEGDAALAELGGIGYLAELFERAPPVINMRDHARVIIDRALRREMIVYSEEMGAAARDAETEAVSILETAERNLFAIAEQKADQGGFKPFTDAIDVALDTAAKAYARDGGIGGLSTGFADLDAKLGGLHPSDLLILAGRPSMGKTALATNIAFNVARRYTAGPDVDGVRTAADGGVVAFFSLEMDEAQLATRIGCDISGVSGDRIRKGQIDASEFGRFRDALDEVRSVPLHIDATGGISIAKLSARARRLKRKHGLDLIVIDYLQLIAGERSRGGNRTEEISAITGGLKALAKDLNVPVIALSQLSRQVENRDDKRPQLSDLRESGSIEQDADTVMFVYREAYYLGRTEPRAGTTEHQNWCDEMSKVAGLAEVIIGKQRHGPIGTVRMSFSEDFTRFGNLAREGRFDDGPPSRRLPYGDQ